MKRFNEDQRFILFMLGLIVFSAVFGIGLAIVSSYFESQAFNRVTGAKTTTRDAFFLDLRVIEEVKP